MCTSQDPPGKPSPACITTTGRKYRYKRTKIPKNIRIHVAIRMFSVKGLRLLHSVRNDNRKRLGLAMSMQ
jgi:hypothetical protein